MIMVRTLAYLTVVVGILTLAVAQSSDSSNEVPNTIGSYPLCAVSNFRDVNISPSWWVGYMHMLESISLLDLYCGCDSHSNLIEHL